MSDCLIDHIWLLFHKIFPFYAINNNLNHRNSRKVHKKGNKCYYDSNMIYRYTGYIINGTRTMIYMRDAAYVVTLVLNCFDIQKGHKYIFLIIA